MARPGGGGYIEEREGVPRDSPTGHAFICSVTRMHAGTGPWPRLMCVNPCLNTSGGSTYLSEPILGLSDQCAGNERQWLKLRVRRETNLHAARRRRAFPKAASSLYRAEDRLRARSVRTSTSVVTKRCRHQRDIVNLHAAFANRTTVLIHAFLNSAWLARFAR